MTTTTNDEWLIMRRDVFQRDCAVAPLDVATREWPGFAKRSEPRKLRMQHKPRLMNPLVCNPLISWLATRSHCMGRGRREGAEAANQRGDESILQKCQPPGMQNIDKSWINKKIEVNVQFDLDEKGQEKGERWCSATVKKVSDGTWLIPNARTSCYGVNEAAELLCDAVEECGLDECTGIQELKANKWNKDCIGAWRKYIPPIDYGV